MTDLDALLADEPIAEPTLTGAAGKPAKCRRHRWAIMKASTDYGDHVEFGNITVCHRCGTLKDEARTRRARNNGKRGRRIQAQRIVALGGRNLAGNNENLDGIGEMFAYESKSGAAFSDRYWRWLSGIPTNASQVRVLIVTEAPGPGHRARSYVVVEFDQWRDLHGELVPEVTE